MAMVGIDVLLIFKTQVLCVPSIGISADGLTNSYQGDGTSGIYILGVRN